MFMYASASLAPAYTTTVRGGPSASATSLSPGPLDDFCPFDPDRYPDMLPVAGWPSLLQEGEWACNSRYNNVTGFCCTQVGGDVALDVKCGLDSCKVASDAMEDNILDCFVALTGSGTCEAHYTSPDPSPAPSPAPSAAGRTAVSGATAVAAAVAAAAAAAVLALTA